VTNFFCDGFELGALARGGRDYVNSGFRKSEHHCPTKPTASASHNGDAARNWFDFTANAIIAASFMNLSLKGLGPIATINESRWLPG
jgi:hypothetical protein